MAFVFVFANVLLHVVGVASARLAGTLRDMVSDSCFVLVIADLRGNESCRQNADRSSIHAGRDLQDQCDARSLVGFFLRCVMRARCRS